MGFGKDLEQFDDVTIQPDGNIVVAESAGDAQAFDGNDFVVGRLLPDGSHDPAFAGGGAISDSGGDDRAWAVAVQADGKILVAGETDDDTDGMTVTVPNSIAQDSETFTITVTDVETMRVFLPLVLRSH